MKIYKHYGMGYYIGSVIIVIAECESEAREVIRKQLDDCGLPDEKLNITEHEIKPCVVYVDSGDY